MKKLDIEKKEALNIQKDTMEICMVISKGQAIIHLVKILLGMV